MDVVISVSGVKIRLPEERWQHIIEEHPELIDLRYEILDTVKNPNTIFGGSAGELLAVRELVADKFLIVVYRELNKDDGFIITAFLIRKVKQLERRQVLWPLQ